MHRNGSISHRRVTLENPLLCGLRWFTQLLQFKACCIIQSFSVLQLLHRFLVIESLARICLLGTFAPPRTRSYMFCKYLANHIRCFRTSTQSAPLHRPPENDFLAFRSRTSMTDPLVEQQSNTAPFHPASSRARCLGWSHRHWFNLDEKFV